MSSPLPLAKPDDPRLSSVVQGSLERCRLDPEWLPTVMRLATGEIPTSTLHCCGSGCRPCVADLVRCTRMALETLQTGIGGPDGLPQSGGDALPHPAQGLFRGRDSGLVRRLARAALKRWGPRG